MSVLAIAPLFLRPSALNPIQSCFVWSFGVFGIMGAAIQGRRRSNTGRISTKDDAVLPPLRTAKTVVWLALSALWASASLLLPQAALGSAPLDSLNPPRLFVAHPCGWPFIRPSSDRDSSKGRKIRTVSYTGPVSRFRSLGPSGAARTSPNFPHDNYRVDNTIRTRRTERDRRVSALSGLAIAPLFLRPSVLNLIRSRVVRSFGV